MVASFVVDGVIAGVGSVIVFLPQILILFLFIILMEDTGYLARAAFLVDRAMRSVGLSGQSVIPLLSSFACAVPSIMATRVIPNRRDRIATILAAPFMTCSARLPVYALLIAAFVPSRAIGILESSGPRAVWTVRDRHHRRRRHGVVAAQLGAARRESRRSFSRCRSFVCRTCARSLMKLLDRVRVFLGRAGTVIFAVAVVVWALAYFPRSRIDRGTSAMRRGRRPPQTSPVEALEARLARSTIRRRRTISRRVGSGERGKSSSRCSRRSAGTGAYRPR